jgi:hypothetical protein
VWLLLAAMQAESIHFADLRYFLSQFHDAFFNRILHGDRLAEHTGRSGRKVAHRQVSKDYHDQTGRLTYV